MPAHLDAHFRQALLRLGAGAPGAGIAGGLIGESAAGGADGTGGTGAVRHGFAGTGGERGPITLVESVPALAACAWIERRLFELVGAWAREAEEPEAALLFDAESRSHGWSSSMLAAELPLEGSMRAAGSDPSGDLLRSGAVPSLVSDGARSALATLEEKASSTRRAGSLCRVLLPRLQITYRSFALRLPDVAAASMSRAVAVVAAETSDLRDAAEVIFQALLGRAAGGTAHQTAELAETVATLEAALAAQPRTATASDPAP